MTHIKAGHSVVVVPKEAPQVQQPASASETSQAKTITGTQTATGMPPTSFAQGLPPGSVLVLTQSGKDADRAAADAIRGANPSLYATREVGKNNGDESFRKSSDAAFHASSEPRSILSHAVQAGAVAATSEVVELGLKASTLTRDAGKTIFTWDASKFTPRELGTQVRSNIAQSLERLKPKGPVVVPAKIAQLADKAPEMADRAQRGATQAARALKSKVPIGVRVGARRGLVKGLSQLRQAGTAVATHGKGAMTSLGNTVVRGHTLQRWGARYFGIAKRGLTGLGNSVSALPQRALNSSVTSKVGQFVTRHSGKLMAGIPILGSVIAIHFAEQDFKHAVKVEMDPTSPFGKRVLANLTSVCSLFSIIPVLGLPAAIGGIASSSLEKLLYPENKASHA